MLFPRAGFQPGLAESGILERAAPSALTYLPAGPCSICVAGNLIADNLFC